MKQPTLPKVPLTVVTAAIRLINSVKTSRRTQVLAQLECAYQYPSAGVSHE
jgi:hypothetical protein